MLKNLMKFSPNPHQIPAIFVLVLALAGCADQPPRSTASGSQVPSVTLNYAETAAGPGIDVTAFNMLPLTAAALVESGGRTTESTAIDRDVARTSTPFYNPSPSVGVGVFGGSGGGGGGGIGIGVPLGGYSAPQTLPPIRSHVVLPIQDLDGYRRNWRSMLVRLRYGSQPGEVLVSDIPAPPPPGATR
jgi:hypothetical protein